MEFVFEVRVQDQTLLADEGVSAEGAHYVGGVLRPQVTHVRRVFPGDHSFLM